MSVVAVIPQWFTTKRGAAMGFSSAGTGIGGLALSPMVKNKSKGTCRSTNDPSCVPFTGKLFDFQVWNSLGIQNHWADGIWHLYVDYAADQDQIASSSYERKDQVPYQTVDAERCRLCNLAIWCSDLAYWLPCPSLLFTQ